jgi:hypothetical protein
LPCCPQENSRGRDLHDQYQAHAGPRIEPLISSALTKVLRRDEVTDYDAVTAVNTPAVFRNGSCLDSPGRQDLDESDTHSWIDARHDICFHGVRACISISPAICLHLSKVLCVEGRQPGEAKDYYEAAKPPMTQAMSASLSTDPKLN